MGQRTCGVEDCERIVYGHGWCRPHLRRWQKDGDPGPAITPRPAQCSVEGCTGAPRARGLCAKHYTRWSKHGDPMVVQVGGPSTGPRATCEVIGCDSPNVARRLCNLHYRRLRAKGTTADGRVNARQRCAVPACTGMSETRGLCVSHRGIVKRCDKHGITPERYFAMLEQQGYVCAICHLPSTDKRSPWLSVDHDHTTGEVRGLLCGPCNRGIGQLGDNTATLRSAIEYLLHH